VLQYFAVRITNTGSYWQAPLGVRSAKRRHQSPEWMILINVNCFIQGEVIGFQVLLDSLHPCSTRASWWSHPVLQGEPVKVLALFRHPAKALPRNKEAPHLIQEQASRICTLNTRTFNFYTLLDQELQRWNIQLGGLQGSGG